MTAGSSRTRIDHPDEHALHLWRFDLDTGRVALNDLAADERQRADRFHYERDRLRYVAGRTALRTILARYLDSAPQALRFTYNAQGKPALEPPAALRFNLAHSDNHALLAVTTGPHELGIDLEHLRPGFATDTIAERFFAPEETAALRALPQPAQEAAFFRCWTRKEAYIKACAQGLHMPLDSFDVSLGADEPARFLRNGEGWSMASFQVEPDYEGAIVAEGSGWSWQFVEG